MEYDFDQVTVIDCGGRPRYQLTLLVDGNVQVRFASGVEAIVDIDRRRCLTPLIRIPDELWSELAAMRPGGR